MRAINLTIIVALLITKLGADYSGYTSLQIVPSARECAMATVGVASALGPQAMYYNSALSSTLSDFAINVNYANLFLDTDIQSLFLVRPFGGFNLGFGIVNYNAGKLEYRPNFPTDEPYGTFTPSDFNFFFNFSTQSLSQKPLTGIGVSARWYYQKISEYSASGIGVDAGFTVNVLNNLKLGLAINNFGTAMKFQRRSFSLPTKLAGGISYQVRFQHLTIENAFDVDYLINDRKVNFNDGIEFGFDQRYFLRAGYRASDNLNDYNVGFGLLVKNIRIEYALSPNKLDLASNHHFSISFGY